MCDVARRHGLVPTQLFTWRRDAKLPREARSAPTFAPVVIEAPALPVAASPRVEPKAKKTRRSRQGGIELEIDGVVMRVSRGARSEDGCGGDQGAEGRAVISPPSGVRVLVATKPIDFRKGANGLAALIKDEMRADPFSGVIYVFRAKRADRIKLLYWDGTGVVLVAKTLEQGAFRWPRVQDGVMRLTASQLSALCSTAWTGRVSTSRRRTRGG